MAIDYKSAGVDLQAADESLANIATLAKTTFTENVLRGIGLFAGFYALNKQKYQEPILVSSIDGVGTKLKIAFMMNVHDTVGHDLVNHCVNDIMTSGADPLFFLDYIGTHLLNPSVATAIVKGMANGCKENGCALIGGETAEMPGFYSAGEYELVGTIVGLAEKDKIIDGRAIAAKDVLIGLPSNGFHTNGYSLIRKILFDHVGLSLDHYESEAGATWGEILLKIHRSYKNAITAIRSLNGVKGISHITGGGIEGNTKRLLRKDLHLRIDWESWDVPVEFLLIQQYGSIEEQEMRRVFNLGIGLVIVADPEYADRIRNQLVSTGESPVFIGHVE